MNSAFQSLFQPLLLLALVLVPGRLAAQGLQGAPAAGDFSHVTFLLSP